MMTLSPKGLNMDRAREQITKTHEIVYMVKRPSYEFLFAVPRKVLATAHDPQPLLLTRFKDQYQRPCFTLDMSDMKDFYEGLGNLLEYIRVEQEKETHHR